MQRRIVQALSVLFAALLVTASISSAVVISGWEAEQTGVQASDLPAQIDDQSAPDAANPITTTLRQPERTVYTDDFGDNDISDWNTSGHEEQSDSGSLLPYQSINPAKSSGVSVQSINEGDVIADSGRMRLRVHQCYFVDARRSLGTFEGNLTVSFDWETAADQGVGNPQWRLVNETSGDPVSYEIVSGSNVASPGYGGNESGSVAVRAEVDGPVAIEFLIEPSIYCGNSDHANTYLWIDNVAVDYRPVPPITSAVADNFSDGDVAEWRVAGQKGALATSNDSGNVTTDVGRMRLRTYRCYRLNASRTLGIFDDENVTVSFDWETSAENVSEQPGWRLVNVSSGATIPYEVVAGTDVTAPGNASSEQGSMTARAAVDGTVAVEFLIESSGSCNQSDHGNNTLWVDDLNATYQLPPDSDHDGLPDDYEINVVQMGAYESDSDAAATSASEVDDGIIDSLEDLDGDGVAVYYEYRAGTDQFAVDTDNDDLTDDFELRFGPHPLEANADGDNFTDDQDDADGDALVNVREQNLGTHPFVNDTDSDDLDDSREIDVLGTNATNADTDADGLPDGEELELGTDPLVNDTDANGIVDGNETYTTIAQNVSVGVAVNVSGNGNVAKELTIENDTRMLFRTDAISNTTATNLVELESGRAFGNATVTFAVNTSAVGNASDLRVFTYNETRGTFEPLNSTLGDGSDGGAGTQSFDTMTDSGMTTVSANTTHFSTFGVFNETAWAARFDDPLPSEWGYNETFEDPNNWTCSGDCDTSGDGVVIRPDGSSGTSSASTSDGETHTTTVSVSAPTPMGTPTTDDGPALTTEACIYSTLTGPGVEPECGGGGTSTPTDTPTSSPCSGITAFDSETISSEGHCWTPTDAPTATPTDTPTATPTDTPAPTPTDTPTATGTPPCATPQALTGGSVEPNALPCPSETPTPTPTPTPAGTPRCATPQALTGGTVEPYGLPCPSETQTTTTTTTNTTTGSTTAPPPDGELLTSTLDVPRSFDAGIEEITLEASLTSYVSGYGAETGLLVVGEYGTTRTLYSHSDVNGQTGQNSATFSRGISEFAGQTVTVRFKVENDSDSTAWMKPHSFRIKKDTDGDGLSDTTESAEIRTEYGNVSTSLYLADSDGDGLSDGSEIGARTSNDYGPVFAVNSFPDVTDSDSDGLGDYEESARFRAVHIIDTHTEAVDFLVATKDENANAVQYFEQRSVSSDPLEVDTDRDDVGDYAEIFLGTDPDDEDTDGDGGTDGEEQSVGTDPTVYDVRPPQVRVTHADSYSPKDSLNRKYEVAHVTADPSGVSLVDYYLADDKLGSDSTPGLPTEIERDRTFTVGPLTDFADFWTGTTLEIEATDAHDNAGTYVAYQRANVFGRHPFECVPYQATTPYAGPESTSLCNRLGTTSGVFYALGSEGEGAVEGAVDLLTKPSIVIDAVQGVVQILLDLGLLEPLVDMFLADLAQAQEANNPYAKGSLKYLDYRAGWYQGVITGYVLSVIVPTKALSTLKASKATGKVADAVKSNGKLSKVGGALKTLSKPGETLNGRLTTHLAKRGSHVPSEAMAVADGAGPSYKVNKLGESIYGDKWESMDGAEQRKLGKFLIESEERGSDLVQELDASTVGKILDRGSGKAALRLNEMGVPASRIDELVATGIDLKRHKAGLEIYLQLGKTVDQNGEIAEVLGHKQVVEMVEDGRGVFDESKNYKVYPPGNSMNFEIYGTDGQKKAEFDHLVADENGKVVAVFETKLAKGKASKADTQNTNRLKAIEDNEIDWDRSSYQFFDGDFDGTIEQYTLGPTDDPAYDVHTGFTESEMKAMWNTINQEGI